MEVMQAIRGRRSIRTFLPDPVPSAAIDRLVAALRWAPSAGNLQRRRFYFVTRRRLRARLARLALDQEFVAEAPLVVVACADLRIERDYGELGRDLLCVLDVAAGIENLLLAAHDAGLGSCWVGGFEEDGVRELLRLPRHLRPVSLVAVGFADEDPEPPPRVRRSTAVRAIE